MMYLMDADGRNIRQVCFEQDHDYCPTVLNNGRVLYLRWDYTDTPHVWNRILFSMNPDGTDQMEFYGANSYWPNAIFYARPIPQHPTKIVGIVTGHHVGRVGELVVFDPAQGPARSRRRGAADPRPRPEGRADHRRQADRAQLAEVPASVSARATSTSWSPASRRPTRCGASTWSTCSTTWCSSRRKRARRCWNRSRCAAAAAAGHPGPVQPDRSDATVYLADVYQGPGLQGFRAAR